MKDVFHRTVDFPYTVIKGVNLNPLDTHSTQRRERYVGWRNGEGKDTVSSNACMVSP
jgi:hypothetical protein